MNKICTDIEQSKKLTEILPIESTDVWWAERYGGKVTHDGQYIVDEEPIYYISFIKPSEINYSQDTVKDIPCWSLVALLGALPKGTRLLKSATDDTYHCDCPKGNIDKWYDNPVDAAVEMILKLKEKDLL